MARHQGRPRLTQFQNVMPWVMIAPFGCPVVPDVYMMVEMSSWVTCSACAERLRRWRSPPHRLPPGPSSMVCAVLQSFATASAVSARSPSWIITLGAASPTMKCSSGNGEARVERHAARRRAARRRTAPPAYQSCSAPAPRRDRHARPSGSRADARRGAIFARRTGRR